MNKSKIKVEVEVEEKKEEIKEKKITDNNIEKNKRSEVTQDNISNNKEISFFNFLTCLMYFVLISMIIFVLKPNWQYIFLGELRIKKVEINEYNKESNKAKITIDIDDMVTNDKVICYLSVDDNISSDDEVIIANKDNCEFITEIKDYYIILKDKNDIINIKKITDYINTSFYLDIGFDKVYLPVGAEKNIDVSLKSVGNICDDIIWVSSDNNIATVENGKITGISNGRAEITLSDLYGNNQVIKVTVTNLIDNYVLKKNKPLLRGEVYTLEEANLLDEILAARVEEAGSGTRAGSVAAARFLTLEFQYSIPYFFENGRLNSSGFAYVDGEGRYYHKGLYLHESKFETIEASYVGPAIWGMPLTNFENAGKYVKYAKLPNGLDCSGFVSWAVHNGGFDPGDYGAGEDPEIPNQMTDLGEYTRITKNLLDSGKVKAGDLINWKGHIGIIIGIDDEIYYVAETLDTYGKLVVRTYKKSKLLYPFTHIVLMDSYYKEDGNYTQMWQTTESEILN